MAEYVTNMNFLLNNVKKILLDEQSTIGFKTIKKGVLSPLPIYPSIILLPVKEEYIRRGNKGRVWIKRSIQVISYDKLYPTKEAMKSTNEMADRIANILEDNYEVRDTQTGDKTCFSYTLGQISYGSKSPFFQTYLQSSVVPITYFSLDDLTFDQYFGDITIESINYLIRRIKNDLSSLGHIASFTTPTTDRFPYISIEGPSRGEKKEIKTGQEYYLYTFIINCFSKLIPKESALQNNLALIEDVKSSLFDDQTLNNKVVDFSLDSVDYDFYKSGKSLMYNSKLNYKAWA